VPALPSGWPFWLFGAITIVGTPWILLQAPNEVISLPPLPIQSKIAIKSPSQPESFFASPLFVEGRALMPVADSNSEAQITDESKAIVITSKPTLVGLIANGRSKSAAVLKGADNIQKTLSVSETLDGWRLTRIGRKNVTLVQNGESITLTLQFPETRVEDGIITKNTDKKQRKIISPGPFSKAQTSQQTEDNQ
jgi:hypothetical protein